MLWYKAWLESKDRFFYTLAGMLLVSGLFVLSYDSWHLDPHRMNFRGFVWQALYFRFFHAAWVFSTFFLALGGLLSERNQGAAFSLSLPVRRSRMLLTRAAVAAAEATLTALLPALSIPAFSLLIGRSYPLLQSLEFALLLTSGGMAFLGFGILLSATVPGDWAAVVIGVPAIAGIYSATRSIDALRAFNPQDLFSGAASVHAPSWALSTPLPWSAIAISMGAAVLLVLVSIVVTEKLDF